MSSEEVGYIFNYPMMKRIVVVRRMIAQKSLLIVLYIRRIKYLRGLGVNAFDISQL